MMKKNCTQVPPSQISAEVIKGAFERPAIKGEYPDPNRNSESTLAIQEGIGEIGEKVIRVIKNL